MKVLLTGANGQLGLCIQEQFPKDWTLIAKDSKSLDIIYFKEVKKEIEKYNPEVIINAAAYTLVDKAESEQKKAYDVNVIGAANLAKVAKSIGARFFHISTDYVFDGASEKSYFETDQTNPINIYGKTKLEGENKVLSIYPENSTIIRTSWVVSQYGNNFVKTIARLAKTQDELKIINDQFGCLTYAIDIANCIITMIKQNIEASIYHYSGLEPMSWFDFAHKIIDVAFDLKLIDKKVTIKGMPASEYKCAAKRPCNSILDNEKLLKLKITYSDVNSFLKEILNRLN